MLPISFVKFEVDILKKAESQLNGLINNMYKNKLIIEGINNFFIDQFNDKSSEETIKSNLKKVCEKIKYVNTTKIIPNVGDIITSTIELTIVENGYTMNSDISEEIEIVTKDILQRIFSFDKNFYEEYKKNIIEAKILNEIPEQLLDIQDNQSFKQYVKTLADKLLSLNQKRRADVNDIKLDFYDYEDEPFERKLINEIKSERYVIISGPSIEEALFYTGYVLQKNSIKNIYIVDSIENWNLIQSVKGSEYYNNIIFIAMFAEDVEPIPNSTTIILVDNNSCQTQAEGLLKFEKRRKDISVDKLQSVLPMVPNLVPVKGKYTYNDIYREIRDCYNEYSVYKNLMFKSLSQVKCTNLTKDYAILALIGSFSKNIESKDYKLVTKYFPVLVDTLNNELPFDTITFGDKFTILNREKIIRDILELNLLDELDFNNYITFSEEIYYTYINEKNDANAFFASKQQISQNLYDAISTTCTLLLKNNDYHKVNRGIYEGVIGKIDDKQLKTKVKISLFQYLLKYDIEYLITELREVINYDESSILNDNIPGQYFHTRTYGEDLLRILERLLYSEEYSLEIPEIIEKGICTITNDSVKDKYISVLKRYFSYMINDYPIGEDEKLKYLGNNTLVSKSILEYIVNTEYKMGSWFVNEIKEEFGYIQCKRERFVKERIDYAFDIQKLYLNSTDEVVLEKCIDEFNIYNLYYENNSLLEYIDENIITDYTLVRSLLKLRRKLSLGWGWNNKDKEDLFFTNGFILVEMLEKKLSKTDFKNCYIFESYHKRNLLLTVDLIGDQSLEKSNEIIENMRRELLKKDKNVVKKLVKMYMQCKTEWIDSISFVIEAMVYAEITFEQAVEIFGFKISGFVK